MSRFSILVAGVGCLTCGQIASAIQPTVENHFVVDIPTQVIDQPTYVDLSGSDKTVSVPTGVAVISWTGYLTNDSGISEFAIRPVIGILTPNLGLRQYNGSGVDRTAFAGSWSTPVDAGEIVVKFQARSFAGSGRVTSGFSWTLVVYPNEPNATVPAVSTWGLIVMAMLMLSAGTLVMTRRKPVVV